MKCEELLAALNEYVDGEQQSVLCQALQEHLTGCNPCQIVIDNIRHTITLYRKGEAVPLPLALHEQLRGLLREQWARKFPAASGSP
jgi:predicted anti-sigma-YlaC factor YlaD